MKNLFSLPVRLVMVFWIIFCCFYTETLVEKKQPKKTLSIDSSDSDTSQLQLKQWQEMKSYYSRMGSPYEKKIDTLLGIIIRQQQEINALKSK